MERKRILLWSPIVFAPDVDYFLARDLHRALLSNIWIPLYIMAAWLILWRRRDPSAAFWEWAFRPGMPGAFTLVVYYLHSHILMDFFAGGISMFWPLTTRNFYYVFQIVVDTATNQPVTTSEGGTEPDIVSVSSNFEWWSVVDTAIAAFLVVAVAGYWFYRRWHRARFPPAVVVRRGAAPIEGQGVMGPSHKE